MRLLRHKTMSFSRSVQPLEVKAGSSANWYVKHVGGEPITCPATRVSKAQGPRQKYLAFMPKARRGYAAAAWGKCGLEVKQGLLGHGGES